MWDDVRNNYILHTPEYDRAVYAGMDGAQKCVVNMCLHGETLPLAHGQQNCTVTVDPDFPKWQMNPGFNELMKHLKKEAYLNFSADRWRDCLASLGVIDAMYLDSFKVLNFPHYLQFVRIVQEYFHIDLRNAGAGDFTVIVPEYTRTELNIAQKGAYFDVIEDMKLAPEPLKPLARKERQPDTEEWVNNK